MTTSTYPVRVDAELDNNLSRWLWLVKWLLALPHYVILAFPPHRPEESVQATSFVETAPPVPAHSQ
jgi:hypothetical protein